MKKSIYVSLTDWIGRNLIGDIEEVARRSGVRLRHDFYWPRKSIVLPKASNIELVERLGENELRRSMARSTVLFCMAISLPLSTLISFGVPRFLVGTKTTIKETFYGAKNLTNFSTSCILGREDRDSLLNCQKSLRVKSGNIDSRLQSEFSNKAKFDSAYSLMSLWKQKDEAERQETGEVDSARFKKIEEQLTQNLTDSEISELRSIYSESVEYNKELAVISAKLKVDYYKTKAQSGGLTEQENSDYQSQIKIIKNQGGK